MKIKFQVGVAVLSVVEVICERVVWNKMSRCWMEVVCREELHQNKNVGSCL